MKKITAFKSGFVLGLTLLMGACGGGGTSEVAAGFNLEMPSELKKLNHSDRRVTGSVWQTGPDGSPEQISAERDATLTYKGNFAVPTKGLNGNDEYEYRLKIYYRAEAATTAALEKSKLSQVETAGAGGTSGPIIINANVSGCQFDLKPDSSLSEGADTEGKGTGVQWLLLCEATIKGRFDAKQLMDVATDEIHCEDFDADGDEVSNLDEIDQVIDPFSADRDGDCITDKEDAFPADAGEWRDKDGDGLGDKLDKDSDGDNLSNEDEAAKGSDPYSSDTDGDGVGDGSDNCLLIANTDQKDTDADLAGNACDNDADNDSLSDADEAKFNTDPSDADSDDDGLSDGEEIKRHTNPNVPDTDGDGIADSADTFPSNKHESRDEDHDGLGDLSDLCPGLSDPGNLDSDSDGKGNPCDNDDDNDGVSDAIESRIGSNPLSTDSDGDGLTDWFGGVKTSGQDGCLLVAVSSANATSHATDHDEDGFGAACDCDENQASVNPAAIDTPDSSGTDNNCDGVDGEKISAIFVSGQNGSDANDGSAQTNPVATLKRGLELAQASKKQVQATAGTYTLTESLALLNGVTIYGGFSSDFTKRDMKTPTVIASAALDTLVTVSGVTAGLDGVTLLNESKATNAMVIKVANATLSIRNSKVAAGNTAHLIAIDSQNATLQILDSKIEISRLDSTSNTGTAVALKMSKTLGSFKNSQIRISNYATQRTAFTCESAASQDFVIADSAIDLLPGIEKTNAAYDYLIGCSGSAYNSADVGKVAVPTGAFDGYNVSGLQLNTLF